MVGSLRGISDEAEGTTMTRTRRCLALRLIQCVNPSRKANQNVDILSQLHLAPQKQPAAVNQMPPILIEQAKVS